MATEPQPVPIPTPKRTGGMLRTLMLVLIALLLAAAAFLFMARFGGALVRPAPTPQIEGVTSVDPPIIMPNFTLTDQAGQPLSLSDLKGKLTLLFFGFTYCPDVCPTTLDTFKRIRRELGDQAQDVQFAFISVDGTRDTPERLSEYLQERGVSDFVTGLTGPEDEVRQIGQPFGLFFEVNPGTAELENYLVDHSTPVYLLDRDGNLRTLYSFGTTPEIIAQNIRLYL